MADGTRGGSADATLDLITTDELSSGTYSGTKAQVVKLGQGASGAMEEVSAANPLPVTGTVTGVTTVGTITNVVHVDDNAGSITVDGPLTDTQLRATPVPVSGTVTATPTGTQTVSGTVALGAGSASVGTLGANSGVDVGDVTINNASGASAVNVQDGGNSLTVDGTVTANAGTGTFAVSGPLTDAQLRATAVPVSGTVTVTGAGDATAANQSTQITAANLTNTDLGGVTETAPATDTASSGLNGRLQRVAQRLTSLIALLPASLGQKTKAASLAVTLASDQDALPITDNAGSLTVDGTFWQATQPVSGTVTANLAAGSNNIGDVDVLSVPAPLSTTGGGTEATALRVTIANNSTGVVGVTGTFWQATQPVSGTVTANAGTGTLAVSGPVTDAQLRATPVPVSGTVTATPTGTYTTSDTATQVDDAAFTPATSRVLMVGAEFDDSAPDSVNEGDGGAVRMSANRNLYGTIRDAAGNERGANVSAGNALLTDSSATTQPVSGTVTANAGTGTLAVSLATLPALTTGAAAIGKLAANSGIDIGDVDVTSIIPGTGATNLGKAVDSVAGATDTGTLALVVRDDALATLTPADGDYTQLRTDSTGAQWVHATDGMVPLTGSANLGKAIDTTAGGTDTGVAALAVRDDTLSTLTPVDGDWAPLRVDSTGALWVNAGTGPAQYAEDAAHVSGDLGNPLLGVREDTPTSTAGTTGDYTAVTADSNGRLWVNAGTTTVANSQVAPTTSAGTLIAARTGRQRVTFQNIGSTQVYIGIATVTAANGFPLDPGDGMTLNTSALVQAISIGATGNVSVIEEYL